MSESNTFRPFRDRFRRYLPVVVDVETAGFNAETDALLEVAVIILAMRDDGKIEVAESHQKHIAPFEGANLDASALAFNGIDPFHPFRMAVSEHEGLSSLFKPVRQAIKANECTRAILVGHNAYFDLSFINAASKRANIKRNPFHPFSIFDTVSLAGLAYGQTVLSRAIKAAGMEWNESEAHSALYDAERTAELFCNIVNQWKMT